MSPFKSVLLDSVCYNFVKDFYLYVHQLYWFSFFVASLSGFGRPGICTPAVQTGHIFPLRTFWMFSRNLQSFDYTHTVRLNVTFPTGDCPTWVQLLHLVFLFVLEKAPATFGQHSSCWPCLWDHFSPTQSSRGCSL